jgi:predicted metal-dependent hydrolase
MVAKQVPSIGITRAAFKREVRTWARRIGVHPKEIHLRKLTSKQASCSPKGRITFSTSLLSTPAAMRTEAIVHELVHLKIPNHGKLFKQIVVSLLGSKCLPV